MVGDIQQLVLVLGIVVAAASGGLRAWRQVACRETDAARGCAAHAAAVLARADAARGDPLAAALAGLSGIEVALLTHFTAPCTTILAAVLVEVLVAGAPSGRWQWGN
ncbi:hypothetical protein E3O53_11970 [Cryobacterium sp. TMT2-18-3]|uniref:hypothetical protein n=1 Tax=unclassified Cryobacterium TaxID=2649013 RepID=UPI0010694A5D|nr:MULTISPECIES: hypothetical protein [unclassified Cryobacterium]TFC31997.1 hypothetical protein E3O22_00910 [Cryobacterium sp. TMT2-18-2]TFC62909.1 hypothetical protein E3O53_11970 [Cryobacterium sp. TMT2-18-3]